MSKENTVVTVKETLKNSLISDMRLLKMFDIEANKNTDYLYQNIFDYFKENEAYDRTDSFIEFDASTAWDSGHFQVNILVKVHSDLIAYEHENKADIMSELISDIVKETFSDASSVKNVAIGKCDRFVVRHISFTTNGNSQKLDLDKGTFQGKIYLQN